MDYYFLFYNNVTGGAAIYLSEADGIKWFCGHHIGEANLAKCVQVTIYTRRSTGQVYKLSMIGALAVY